MQCLYFWRTHVTLLFLTSTSPQGGPLTYDAQSLVCLEITWWSCHCFRILFPTLGPYLKCCPGSDHSGKWSPDLWSRSSSWKSWSVEDSSRCVGRAFPVSSRSFIDRCWWKLSVSGDLIVSASVLGRGLRKAVTYRVPLCWIRSLQVTWKATLRRCWVLVASPVGKLSFGLEVLWCFMTRVVAGGQLWACSCLNELDPDCRGKSQQISLVCPPWKHPQGVRRKSDNLWRKSIRWWGRDPRSTHAPQLQGRRPETFPDSTIHNQPLSNGKICVLVAIVRSVWPCAKLFGLSSLSFSPSMPGDRLAK